MAISSNILSLRNTIEDRLSNLSFPQEPKGLYEPIKYILGLGGKRTRPLLTLLSAQLFNSNYNDAIKTAIALEVFHNFTLMHDDIMDNAPLRRGAETVHVRNELVQMLIFLKAYTNRIFFKNTTGIRSKKRCFSCNFFFLNGDNGEYSKKHDCEVIAFFTEQHLGIPETNEVSGHTSN